MVWRVTVEDDEEFESALENLGRLIKDGVVGLAKSAVEQGRRAAEKD